AARSARRAVCDSEGRLVRAAGIIADGDLPEQPRTRGGAGVLTRAEGAGQDEVTGVALAGNLIGGLQHGVPGIARGGCGGGPTEGKGRATAGWVGRVVALNGCFSQGPAGGAETQTPAAVAEPDERAEDQQDKERPQDGVNVVRIHPEREL